ncbi:hypothetical protein CONCODRAFT_12758 [Conidiobolus coronatus NRRL 28638]|uniref:Uncharacterized protein n=1 Tax=Conidiobolus coronatus (strain ATCC 28846 / CBS 209.66 / NRRL 28638) TaxID=796925 RepID=A0A137NS92_CONC2|nr:hypothetical protein CONCODRAFT_12758 [Conidiobolus coronatus NRRL 28638]|eukprot:KXN65606.1 hypothetical protein CONCODRAFT_12758 [Conidiobolus coronatus NRRL 28638]
MNSTPLATNVNNNNTSNNESNPSQPPKDCVCLQVESGANADNSGNTGEKANLTLAAMTNTNAVRK